MTFIYVKCMQKWSGVHTRGLTSIPAKGCGEGGDAQPVEAQHPK